MTPPAMKDDCNGTLFIDVYSLPGSYAEVLPFCINIQVSDYTRSDEAELLGSKAAVMKVPFHASNNTEKDCPDHDA